MHEILLKGMGFKFHGYLTKRYKRWSHGGKLRRSTASTQLKVHRFVNTRDSRHPLENVFIQISHIIKNMKKYMFMCANI